MMDNLLRDFRLAIRQLSKTPGFTFTAILTLSLGICASVAIFAFVEAALLKPLSYVNPARLVGVFETVPMFPQSNLSYLDYLDWKKLNNVFSSLDVYQHNDAIVSTVEGPQQVFYARVSDGFFRTLGTAPLFGRDFYPGEDLPGVPNTVLLSFGAWQNRYGEKRDVLGQTVTLDGIPNVIIGVLPKEFHFAPAEPAEFWTALHASNSCETRRSCHDLFGVARLKDDVSFDAALAGVKLIAGQLEKQYPDSNRDQGAALAPLTEVIVGNVRPILLVLLSGAALLLLIACVNVASLLLVRSESRRREMAVRSALGASASRLFLQFVTEALLLVAAGSALGLASAQWAMQLLTKLIPARMRASMPYLDGLDLNYHVLIFAGVISLFAAMLFSCTPAMRLSLLDMRSGMAEGSRGSSGNTWRRLGSNLVIVELATAVVLLTGAGLLGKSLYLLLQVDIGFQADHLATLYLSAPGNHYASDEQAVALQRQIVNRIATLPGVESVGLAQQLPVSHNGNTIWFRVVGRPFHGEHNESPERKVSAGYFTTLKARLLSGRYFRENEDLSKPRVAIINRAMARRYFQGEDPVGKQVVYLLETSKPMQIVGVIEDIKEGPLDTATPPVIYLPLSQEPRADFSIVVRTRQAEESLLPAMAAAIRAIDAGIVTAAGASMSSRINDAPSTYLHRSPTWLVGGFAGMALLLSVIGLYGVIAYSVSQRSREIGVRMALGAQPFRVYQLILKEAGNLVVFGIVGGLLCSIAGATLMRKLLFGTPPWDVLTLVAVTALLAISALSASYFPARRAASLNPVEALRAE